MTNETLYGLYSDQHSDFLGMQKEYRRGSSGSQDPAKEKRYRPPIRVIALTDREYDSTSSERLPIFVYDRNKLVYTVEQVGTLLQGYLALTIGSERFIIECRTDSLADVSSAIPGLRATVLPGLWELDFGFRDSAATAALSVSVERITDDEDASLCALFDDEDTLRYTGSVIVRKEYWCTQPDATQSPAVVHIEVTDSIPYSTGAVGMGAIGSAHWNWDAGYTATAWQCRTFSHASLTGTCTYRWQETTAYSGIFEWALITDNCDNGTSPTPPLTDGTFDGETRPGTCSIGGA